MEGGDISRTALATLHIVQVGRGRGQWRVRASFHQLNSLEELLGVCPVHLLMVCAFLEGVNGDFACLHTSCCALVVAYLRIGAYSWRYFDEDSRRRRL